MKKAREIKTSKQQAIWVPERLIEEFLKLAEARGIEKQRRDTSTVKALLKELAIEEAERLNVDINENVVRYAKMGVK